LGIIYIEANKSANKKVEKGKLSERIGRKVMGLKHCHWEEWNDEAISYMPWSPSYRLYFFIFFLSFPHRRESRERRCESEILQIAIIYWKKKL